MFVVVILILGVFIFEGVFSFFSLFLSLSLVFLRRGGYTIVGSLVYCTEMSLYIKHNSDKWCITRQRERRWGREGKEEGGGESGNSET